VTTLRAVGATDVGRLRNVNQDHLLVGDGLWVVADGMGGHQGGEVASATAVESVRVAVATGGTDQLVESIAVANGAVLDQARGNAELAGMGTTLTALALVPATDTDGDVLLLANVGDSRTYLLPAGGELVQLTADHSLVAEMVRAGQLTEEEAADHPRRNIITRALGTGPTLDIDSWRLTPVTGDRYLLCSDGLCNEVDDISIAEVLRTLEDPAAAAEDLIRRANASGGRDNITVVLVDVVEADRSVDDHPGDRRLPVAADVANAEVAGADVAGADAAEIADADVASANADDPPVVYDAAADLPEPPLVGRRRRPGWRVVAFATALIALLGIAAVAIGISARGTYFVGMASADGDVVVIYQGKPGGTLWFDPTVVDTTDLPTDTLPVTARRALADGVQQSTLEGARAYVDDLRDQASRPAATTPTTSTTTTAPPTTEPASSITATPTTVAAGTPGG
jgi:PPM family protein phosphatase